LRPCIALAAAPIPAPTTASGMISQLAQPSKGRKATAARISATKPMTSETMLTCHYLPMIPPWHNPLWTGRCTSQ
jgi:hypothetical protein